MSRRKKVAITIVIILGVLLLTELFLRYYWGFCDMVLVEANDKYEYIAQPNQNRHRMRKHIKYNALSMRSDDLQETDSIRILGFGDSVINGNMLLSHDSLAITIIEKELSKELHAEVRCLNISSGSWGPDNCFAYLKEHGDFNARLIFLVVSSHDAYDNMTFGEIVDKHPHYPSKQYPFALYELVDRYIIPYLTGKNMFSIETAILADEFNPGFSAFYNYTQSKNIPFFMYLHPEITELQNKKYNAMGDTIISFCQKNGIPLIQGLHYETEDGYSDIIHLNEKGQKKLAKILLPEIKTFIISD